MKLVNSNKWLFDCQKEFPQGPMKPIEDIDTNDDLNGMVIVTTTSASSSDTGHNIEADSEASSVMKFHDLITNTNGNLYYYEEEVEDRKDDDTNNEREKDVAVTLATIVEEVEEQLEVQTSQTNSIDYYVAQNGTIIILDDRDDNNYDNNYDRCMYMREEEINSILRSTNSLIDDDHLHHDLILTVIDIGGDDDDDDDLDDIEGLVKFCGLGYLLCKPLDLVTITC